MSSKNPIDELNPKIEIISVEKKNKLTATADAN